LLQRNEHVPNKADHRGEGDPHIHRHDAESGEVSGNPNIPVDGKEEKKDEGGNGEDRER
jgi:hypothetical protein